MLAGFWFPGTVITGDDIMILPVPVSPLVSLYIKVAITTDPITNETTTIAHINAVCFVNLHLLSFRSSIYGMLSQTLVSGQFRRTT